MAQRTGRERKLAERLRNVDSATLAEAAVRQLDALEDDNHAMEREAAELERNDDEFVPTGVDSDDDGDVPMFTKSSKKRRASGAKARKRGKAGRADRSKRRKGSSVSDLSKISGGSNIERWNMSLSNMLQREPLSLGQRPARMVHYDALTASASSRPSRPFCAVCGYNAAYTCRRCTARFCSIPCDAVHQQAQCLKFIS